MTFINPNQELLSKEQFLIEHNRLSPANLQVTFALLTRFQEEEKPNLIDTNWSFKLRMPLISWLFLLPAEKKKAVRKSKKYAYNIYPYPEDKKS